MSCKKLVCHRFSIRNLAGFLSGQGFYLKEGIVGIEELFESMGLKFPFKEEKYEPHAQDGMLYLEKKK